MQKKIDFFKILKCTSTLIVQYKNYLNFLRSMKILILIFVSLKCLNLNSNLN